MTKSTIVAIYNGTTKNAHAIGFPDTEKALRIYEATIAFTRLCVANGTMKAGNTFFLYRNGEIKEKEVI